MESEIKKVAEYYDFGYLIEKESFELWKKKINYDDINKKYLENYFKENNINVSDERKYEIINYIKNLDLNFEKFQFKFLNFNTQKEIEKYTQKKSLVLVSQKFYNLVCDKREEGIEIKYKIKDKKINIIKDLIDINLYMKKNIIFSEFYMNLHILIKIYYYNEEFKKICSLKQIQPNIFYLIDKESIKNYKEYFEYNILYNHIMNHYQKIILIN